MGKIIIIRLKSSFISRIKVSVIWQDISQENVLYKRIIFDVIVFMSFWCHSLMSLLRLFLSVKENLEIIFNKKTGNHYIFRTYFKIKMTGYPYILFIIRKCFGKHLILKISFRSQSRRSSVSLLIIYFYYICWISMSK